MKKSDVFEDFLNTFETDEIKEYCRDMIEQAPDYIWNIPASTSMKYHNATQCQPGGQLYHILMACEIMNYILSLEYIKNKFSQPKKRDCMRTAICLHDMIKCGLDGGQHTVHEHPVLAQKWVEETVVEHDIDPRLKKYIGRLIASHSGEWTSSNRSTVVLPGVENDEQFIVHLCDFCSSRYNIDMIFDQKTIKLINSYKNEYKLNFGKYKGETIKQIQDKDNSYLIWLKNNTEDDFLKKILGDY